MNISHASYAESILIRPTRIVRLVLELRRFLETMKGSSTKLSPQWLKLEEIYPDWTGSDSAQSAPKSLRSALGKALSSAWQISRKGIQSLWNTLQVNRDLKVWKQMDPKGQVWWYAYDYHTDRFICAASEDELRIWIEQRYYLTREWPDQTCLW